MDSIYSCQSNNNVCDTGIQGIRTWEFCGMGISVLQQEVSTCLRISKVSDPDPASSNASLKVVEISDREILLVASSLHHLHAFTVAWKIFTHAGFELTDLKGSGGEPFIPWESASTD